MRTLLINLCSNPLSELEFVKPVEQILKSHGIIFHTKHYNKVTCKDIKSSDKVIICGTALKDAAFLEDLNWLIQLYEAGKSILGIGSSSQALVKFFNGRLIDRVKIGVFKVKVVKENRLVSKRLFQAYFLTKKVASDAGSLDVLAKAGEKPCMVKHEYKEVYGCFFHPEAMNPEIILNFTLET